MKQTRAIKKARRHSEIKRHFSVKCCRISEQILHVGVTFVASVKALEDLFFPYFFTYLFVISSYYYSCSISILSVLVIIHCCFVIIIYITTCCSVFTHICLHICIVISLSVSVTFLSLRPTYLDFHHAQTACPWVLFR